jgi:hypothetical protein
LYLGGELVGAVVAPGPGKAKAASKLGRFAQTVGTNAGVGGLYGYGSSTGTNAGKEIGTSATVSGLASLLPYGMGEAGRKLGGGLASAYKGSPLQKVLKGKVAKAGVEAAERGLKEGEELFNSMHGKYRQTVADAYRQGVERPMAILQDMPAELVAKWNELAQSGQLQKLKEKLFQTSIDAVPGAVGKMEAAQAAVPNKADLATKFTDEILNKPWEREIKPRLARYAAPVLGTLVGSSTKSDLARGAVGAGAGWLLGGGSEGGGVGTATALGLAGAGARPSVRAIARMVTSPSVTKLWAESLDTVLQKAPEALGKYSQVLSREFQRGGPQAALVVDRVLTEKYPDYAEMKASIIQSLAGAGDAP